MASENFVRHARTFALLTLVSRVLGLVRDAVIVRTFGVTGLATAFGIAFQFPNTFRRLFGEGALSAAFIPEYAQLVKRDPALAHRFASLTAAIMGAGLGAITLVLELVIVGVLASVTLPDDGRLALVLLAIMLPYMPAICLTAALGGMLQTHGRFAAQAGAPIILNLCMIAAASVSAYALKLPAVTTAIAVAASVTLAGVLQTLWCLRDLRGVVVWTRVFDGAGDSARRMFRKMGPVVLGLGALQVTTLIESWGLLAYPLYVGDTIWGRPYPLDEAAGAALTAAQRLYQFPLGIFGIALATAAFPLLARQADEPDKFVATLRRGVRLALFIGVPATAGLMWVAHDLTAVAFLGGNVTPEGAHRMGDNLIAYGALVGTFSVTHVLTRAFYAKGDTRTPTVISVASAVGGLGLGAGLMFVWREMGLAWASSIAAAVQLGVLAWLADSRLARGTSKDAGARARLFDGPTLAGAARIAVCTAGMLAVLAAVRMVWPREADATWTGHAVRLGAECAAGAGSFAAGAWWLCRTEIRWISERPARRTPEAVQTGK